MKITYDPAADAAYIYLVRIGAGEAVEQVPLYDEDTEIELILDLNADKQLIGIEITSAGKTLPAKVTKRARRL